MSEGARRAARVWAVAIALALAVGLAPPGARTALAASDPLRTEAHATYTLDPSADAVHVAIAITATNLKPNSSQFIYFYRDLGWAVQPGATSVRATDGSGSLRTSTSKHKGYVEADVHLRANLYYRHSVSFTLRYELKGAAPRSASDTRVGAAFASFGVWAWGDAGRSSVKVVIPKGFTSDVSGGPLKLASTAGGETWSAQPEKPDEFYAFFTSDDSSAYASTRVSLPGGVEIVIFSWPEDGIWQATARETLATGVPKLQALIGLPWPVSHDLDVRERFTPLLEGYAGVFLVDEQRIDVSEDLDPLTTIHEASHAWFNSDLFSERWIYEGLAQEYAWRVETALGGDPGAPPTKPDVADPGYQKLEAWLFPAAIRDQVTDDRERYGYEASFYVIDQVVQATGIDGMKTLFAAAKAHTTPYVGAPAPEKADGAIDWRRMLDLAEPIDKPDSSELEAAFRDFAVTARDANPFESRTAARSRYRQLLSAGNGWLPPWTVRQPMTAWGFVAANHAMDDATAVLALRDQVDATAASLGLQPGDALRHAYEGATSSLDDATGLAHRELDALDAIAAAKTKVAETPDLVTSIGLWGETPSTPYEAARSAFNAGDLDEATRQAAAAAAIVGTAPAVGQQRLLLIGVGVAVVLVALVLLLFVLRSRSRRRRAAALAFASASPGAAVADPDVAAVAGTLAATPEEGPPAPTASQPELEGGPASGESPAGP